MNVLSTMSGIQTVAVPGGRLAVEVLAGTTEPVLAIHGLSSSRKLWSWLHAEAPELTLITPDLRGRADSVDVTGPSSVGRHADDMVAVLDQLELDAVHVCGMSMGGFIAVTLAARHPDRVKSLVLVDGGYRFAAPPGLTRELLPQLFADRLDRLATTWDSVDEYLDFFVTHTAPLLNPNDPLLESYLEHDLRGGSVRLSGAAVLSDAADVYFGDNPWDQVTQPVRFLHAEWSVGADSTPAYPPAEVGLITTKALRTVRLAGADHAASIMTPEGAAATAALLREALA